MANDTQVKHRSNTNQSASETMIKETKQQAVKTKTPGSKGSTQKSQGRKSNENPESINQQSKTGQQKPDSKQNTGAKQKTAGNQKNTAMKKGDRNEDKPQQKTKGKTEQSMSRQASPQNGSSQPKAAENKNGNDNRKQVNNKENINGVNKQGNTTENKGNRNHTNNGENKSQPNKSRNQNHNAEHDQEHEVNHKEQSGKFETAFNRIHKALREMVKETESDAFVELLYSGYKNHSLIRKYKSELHQFAKLRNAIVHERVNADYYIAEPHIEVVERIEEICREFEKPQTALSIATSPVFYYYEDAYLKDVLKVINKFDFTRFPVYDKDDKYVALLTSTEIIQWMAKHFSSEVIHFEDVRIRELLTKGKNYFVTFVTEDASLYEIEELFERYHTRGKKLQAVIITETGDRHGKPIGVITPWDLLDSDPAED